MNPTIVAVAFLGFSSGLPLSLSDSTLQAWFSEAGVGVQTIGLFSLVGVPYVFKFLWAPLLDRFQPGWPGRRRDWTLIAQLALMVLLLSIAFLDPLSGQLGWFAIAAFLVAFVSATQDVAIDAYRTEVLAPAARGFGAAIFVAGYRIAMLTSGVGALVLADHLGFNATYRLMALFAAIGVVANLMAPNVAARDGAPQTLAEAVVLPFKAFWLRGAAWQILLLILLYKMGDAFAGRLTTVFLLRELEFSLTDVGAINKGLGLAASLIGGLYGGRLMYRLGLYRSLLLFGVLQAVTNLGFAALALIGKSYPALVVVIGLENITAGMGTAAFVAFLMALCDTRYTATQYALFTAFASLARVFAGPPSGVLVENLDWPIFFLFTFVIALPALAMLHWMRERINTLDTQLAT
ncbi:MAG: MFS transporter [Pseudomonadota bacterium]